MNHRLVVVESPYAGRPPAWVPPFLRWLVALFLRWRNVRYARAAVRDCLLRGEAPFASHLLYTQRGILRDDVPHERQHGIEAGLQVARVFESHIVYGDLGMTPGMFEGVVRARREGRTVEVRSLPGWARRAI